MRGDGSGAFNPNGEITRQEAAVILANLMSALGQPLSASDPAFNDNSQIDSWAKNAVGQIQQANIMSGTGGGNFTPKGEAGKYTREQSIVTLMRVWDIMNADGTETNQQASASKVLIAYFSLMGNTKQVAEEIQAQTGADIFQIIPETSYPTDYDSVRPIAGQEKDDNARPKLANHVENMDEYDIVFIGYPIWIATMPMAVYTFLEEYDFSGKTIIPFSTHRGSALGSTKRDIERTISGAALLNGLAIHDDDVGSDAAKVSIEAWLTEVLR